MGLKAATALVQVPAQGKVVPPVSNAGQPGSIFAMRGLFGAVWDPVEELLGFT